MELTTQKKIIKIYKNNLNLLILDTTLDMFTLITIYKKFEKIIDKMYFELNDIIQTELIDNINRNANLLFDISDIYKKINVNNILKNPNTKHTVTFELTRNKRKLKNSIKNLLINSTSDDLEAINLKIKNLVYRKVFGKTKGDAAKTLRIFRTEYCRTRTQAKLDAITELKKDGYIVTRHWLYTFEAKVPRPSHLASDGLVENKDGYFIIDGYKTKGPGLFGIASEDINCRCDTEVYVTRPYDD